MTTLLPDSWPRARPSSVRPISRAIAYGATCLGLLGGIAGLVLRLLADPPTAWFAVLELGVPAAWAGAVIGAIVGSLAAALRHTSQDDPPASAGVGDREPATS